MLEGLEIKEVLFSEPLKTDLFRLEAEFYTAKSFKLSKSFTGAEIIDFVQYGTSEELNEESDGYPILRLNEFRSNFIGQPSKFCKFIDNSTYQSLKLRKNDVLICRTNGNPKLVGKSALVPQDYDFAFASYLFKIRPKKELINASTLVSFLNSKYGRLEIEKFSMASNQVNFSPAKFREMRIPNLGITMNDKIEKIYYQAFILLEESRKLYLYAETLLLETLGLKNFEPSTDGVNVKSYKESFLATGRIDSEYYQKRYDILENHFDSFDRKRIGDFITNPVASGVTPKAGGDDYTDAESGIPFVRAVDLKNGEVTTENFIYIKPEIHNGILKRTKLKKGDVLFSIAGTVGRCSLFDHTFEANINQAVSILRFEDKFIKRLYLILFFNSEIGKEFVSRYSRQGVQTNLNLAEVADLRVPIIEYTKQEKIAALVEESFRLKKQSEQLLETAKRAVEIAIEQDEEVAIDYINAQAQQLS